MRTGKGDDRMHVFKRKFQTLDELVKLTEGYFAECDRVEYAKDDDGKLQIYKVVPVKTKEQTPYSLTEYALHIGIGDRNRLHKYIEGRVKMGNSPEEMKVMQEYLEYARFRIVGYAEKRLFDKDGVTGAKFFLASNADSWSDKSLVENTHKIINVTLMDSDIDLLESTADDLKDDFLLDDFESDGDFDNGQDNN